MKYFPVLLIILFSGHKISCQNLTDIKLEWLQSKVEKDRLYEAKNDCDALMKYFSEEVIFYEKGDLLTYKWLEEYCPLLPKNLPKPDKIKKKEFLLSLTTAYDILVLCQDKDLRIIRGYFESDQGASNEYSRGSMIEKQR